MNGINAVRRTSENITRHTMKAIDGLAKQSGVLQNVADNLFQQIHGVTNRFENQGEQILKAANVLDSANLRIESTLQSRHDELSHTLDRFSGKADEFGRTLAGYSSNLEGSLSNIELKARAIAEELRDTAETRSRALMAELDRVKHETEVHSDRALSDLRNRFQNVSGELSREFETLSNRLSTASEETRMRAAEAAATLAREQARIREEAARLPTSTRETAESMRRALQDQLRAIEQLTQISRRANAPREITRPEPAPARLPPTSTLSSALIQQEGTPSRGRGASQQDTREGWSLGDLLARASHEDEPPAPAPEPPPAAAPVRLDVGMIARGLDAPDGGGDLEPHSRRPAQRSRTQHLCARGSSPLRRNLPSRADGWRPFAVDLPLPHRLRADHQGGRRPRCEWTDRPEPSGVGYRPRLSLPRSRSRTYPLGGILDARRNGRRRAPYRP